ncbi:MULTISPECIES: carotenoid oxygenase family protein [Mycobacterium]|uniref:Dioxygenase n=1 Tax=Mycobacterium kiyosense TaxID=2871094 RepID=A0A9P3UWN9_9MYCO|nr:MULTISPECIES: carotenoid oxygenase family protein [Mycobacterium]BDE16326.1 lignostilbene alpha-beta-dioxygenase [Mycobacterium sp. 20KCMC460]GLB82802.1 lignostilbene alpha-beta-dioxygenase [Mycobacterium kiyosense]GLB89459.1 lignostilbene alpha-beta-dioxygenase [Mycobacterium kiyosense]GLB94957.1 lignostilbene alpha-beta-dioxygenase [Mycobacterium kiyosense]GLC00381.1 lignostilbene alpha-beta-dioxygenase [Mycobacterium kiyosense]
MTQPTQTTTPLDLTALPALRRYLASLPLEERARATARLSALSGDDLLSLGVSEPQPSEFDYAVDQVDGAIPAELCGTLYRNGPGRWQDHTGRPLHHLFDGDGMLSAFTIRDGAVHYRNRYVRTRHYQGKGGVTHLGTAAPGGWRANIGKTPPNLANTNIVEHAGRLYALWEGGAPYEINPDTLETVGPRRFGGELARMGAYSAHPSICPRTGDMYNFGVEFIPRPHLRIYHTDPKGSLRYLRSARLPYLAMTHDFAITERYLVFLVSPIIPDLMSVALGRKPIGDALRYRPEKGTAFILVPRDGGEIRRIESPAVLQFHLSNAYDDGDEVVVDAVTYENPQLLRSIARFQTTPLRESPSKLTRFRLTKFGRVLRETLSDSICEFPRHHPDREGMPHRYAYFTSRRHLSSLYDSITKVDLSDHSENTYTAAGAGNSFCEPVFVPRPDASAEDEGWLLTVEYQARQHVSRLVILDARDPSSGPVATAQLTHHIPQGFHGNFAPRPAPA